MIAYSLIPYVCGAGATLPGCEQGPLYCFEHGLKEHLHAAGIDVNWIFNPDMHWSGPYGRVAQGDFLPPRGSAARQEIVTWHCQALAQNVEKELRQGKKIVTIGGDHSMAAGSISGAALAYGPDAKLGLIWVDAHADLNTLHSSPSKSLHGMPMAGLLGVGGTEKCFGIKGGVISPENIIYAGLRDIDSGEYDIAQSLGVFLPTMEDLRAQGVSNWLQDAVTRLSGRCDHIILSIDLDGFSTEFAPAVGTPVPGGFTPDEILSVLSGIVCTHAVDMIEIVEFNPTLPGADKTFDLILKILRSLLFEKREDK